MLLVRRRHSLSSSDERSVLSSSDYDEMTTLIKGWGRYNTKMKGAFHTQKKRKNLWRQFRVSKVRYPDSKKRVVVSLRVVRFNSIGGG